MKEKILQLLIDADGYVSGQDICNKLGVSRTAVWKNINGLRQSGYQIDSVNNKGYRLLKEPDALGEWQIKRYLNTKWLGKQIVYDETMSSTNTQAKYLGEQNAENGTVVVTEMQTEGRGRRGRGWISPKGVNCYFTMLLRPELAADRASMITLVSALALAKAIKEITNLEPMIKWPNDVVVHGKKICGILTESSTDLEYIHYIVVGIGVNCNQLGFADEINEVATSIKLETKENVVRARLIGVFLNIFEEYYETFLKTEDLSVLSEEYNQMLINRGKEVKIIEKDEERVMKAIGIDQRGGLIVENAGGQKETIISGEVSVRGLYGYV